MLFFFSAIDIVHDILRKNTSVISEINHTRHKKRNISLFFSFSKSYPIRLYKEADIYAKKYVL